MQKFIAEHQFEISAPYSEGHTLTAIEAKVLNQVRAENIGNNVRAKVKELIAAGNTAEAESLVAEKDASYVFTEAAAGGGSRTLDPVEREARKLARDTIRAALAEQGKKMNKAPEGTSDEEWKEKIAAAIETVAARDDIIAAAKKAVSQRDKAVSSAAADLGL